MVCLPGDKKKKTIYVWSSLKYTIQEKFSKLKAFYTNCNEQLVITNIANNWDVDKLILQFFLPFGKDMNILSQIRFLKIVQLCKNGLSI